MSKDTWSRKAISVEIPQRREGSHARWVRLVDAMAPGPVVNLRAR